MLAIIHIIFTSAFFSLKRLANQNLLCLSYLPCTNVISQVTGGRKEVRKERCLQKQRKEGVLGLDLRMKNDVEKKFVVSSRCKVDSVEVGKNLFAEKSGSLLRAAVGGHDA